VATAPELVRVLPELRTGTLEPIDQPEPVVGKVAGYFKSGETETFKVLLPNDPSVPIIAPWLVLDGNQTGSPR
jgi:hypothetical protein